MTTTNTMMSIGILISTMSLPILLARAQLAMLPPPPMSFDHLAKSPASLALASEFFARERQQPFGASSQARPASSGVGAALPQSVAPVALEAPEWSSSLGNSFQLNRYHSLDEIYAFLDALARRYSHVHVFSIGKTTEGRTIKAIELVNNATEPDFVWLDALTHAREWITGSTILYIIDQLVAGHQSGNPLVRSSAINRKNFIIIPVVNPDGYVYTWTTNRMWRKNRSRSQRTGSKCIGADLNRNFDLAFGGEGASNDPCSHIYSGPYPFSEPEISALGELLWSLRDRIKFYLTIHSFNQLWASPYAHTTEPTVHASMHMRVLRNIQRAVYEAEGVKYEIGPLSTSLYVGSGFGIDFAYDKCGIEHSYLVELRDKGANGFVLPPDQIMPTARETYAGLSAGLRTVFG